MRWKKPQFEASRPVEVKLTGAQKKVNDGEWKSHAVRTSKLEEYSWTGIQFGCGPIQPQNGREMQAAQGLGSSGSIWRPIDAVQAN